MLKKYSLTLFMILMIALSACGALNNDAAQSEREEYVKNYKESLVDLGVTLGEKTISDERFNDQPWVTDRVQLADSDVIVSIDQINTVLYLYEIYHTYNDTSDEDTISLTAQDIIDLYTTPNKEKQAEFNKLVKWYNSGPESGIIKLGNWTMFFVRSEKRYEEIYGEPFIDKSRDLYTAEEQYEVVKWGLENIDYDYIDAIIAERQANPGEFVNTSYLDFLKGIGVYETRKI